MDSSNSDRSRNHKSARDRDREELRRSSNDRDPSPAYTSRRRHEEGSERPLSDEGRQQDAQRDSQTREGHRSHSMTDEDFLPPLGARRESQRSRFQQTGSERSTTRADPRPDLGQRMLGQDFQLYGDPEQTEDAFDDEPLFSEERSASTESSRRQMEAFYSQPRENPPLHPSPSRTSGYGPPPGPRANAPMPRPVRGYRRMNNPQADMLVGARPQADGRGTPIPQVEEEEEDDEEVIHVPAHLRRRRG